MMYYTVLQDSKIKLFVFQPTPKRQILRNLTLFTALDLKICYFYIAQNTQYFVLIFCTQLKSIIIIYTL
jgi:hypothetical protein